MLLEQGQELHSEGHLAQGWLDERSLCLGAGDTAIVGVDEGHRIPSVVPSELAQLNLRPHPMLEDMGLLSECPYGTRNGECLRQIALLTVIHLSDTRTIAQYHEPNKTKLRSR